MKLKLKDSRFFYNEETKTCLVTRSNDYARNKDSDTWPGCVYLAEFAGSKSARVLEAICEVLYLARCGFVNMSEAIDELMKVEEIAAAIDYQVPKTRLD